MPRCAKSRRCFKTGVRCLVASFAHCFIRHPHGNGRDSWVARCAAVRAKGRASFPVSWRVRRSRLRPLLIAAVAAWGRAASGSNGRGLLPALGGCNGGVAPLPSVLFDKQIRRLPGFFVEQHMACISPETKPAPILRIRPSANFQVVTSPTGTPRALASANAKVRPCQKLRDAPPVSAATLSPQAPDCPARKPVTRGGMRAPVGGGSRRPALSDKDGVLLRVIGVG